jgi:hypothetical protein
MTASMQTRLAQGAARDAEAEWKQHAGMCPQCSRLAHDRGAQPCGAGAGLRNGSRQLRAAARRGAELDKQPAPGQEMLPGFRQGDDRG